MNLEVVAYLSGYMKEGGWGNPLPEVSKTNEQYKKLTTEGLPAPNHEEMHKAEADRAIRQPKTTKVKSDIPTSIMKNLPYKPTTGGDVQKWLGDPNLKPVYNQQAEAINNNNADEGDIDPIFVKNREWLKNNDGAWLNAFENRMRKIQQ
jgi:hypothetical protein